MSESMSDSELQDALRDALSDVTVPDDVQLRLASTLGSLLAAPDVPQAPEAPQAPTTPQAASGAASAAAGAGGSALKLLGMAALGVAIGAGGNELVHRANPPAPRVVERTVFVDRQVPAPSASPSAPATEAPVPTVSVRPVVTASVAPSAAPTSRDVELGKERALVDAARSALARGDSASALARIDEHARTFPRGQLSEPRDALRVQALAMAGRADEARAQAARFERTYPNGLYGPVVKDAIGKLPK